MKKFLAVLLSAMMLFTLGAFAGAEETAEVAETPKTEENAEVTESAAASETPEAPVIQSSADGPVEISTAEELKGMLYNLSADYVLTADVDLAGEEWTPAGIFMPASMEPEEQEVPSTGYAFTGTFDGNGHTISNLRINQPEGFGVGLFGCIANTKVGNFTLENPIVDGTAMAAGAVGYAYNSTVYDVKVVGGKVTAHPSELSAEGMYGGVVGAGMNSLITGCSADAEIIIPDGSANAGIVGGGLEGTSVVDCTATGSVTAGADCYGIGGVSGCGFGAEEFTNCKAVDVTLSVGENSFWIGSITGYAGGYELPEAGVPITVFTGCTAENVTIIRLAGRDELVGGAFYNEMAAETYGAPYDEPTVFVIQDDAPAAEEPAEGAA